MMNALQTNDLCISCNFSSLCTKRKNLIRPVWFCEEYDDFNPPLTAKFENFTKTNPNSSYNNSKNNSIKYKGICSNCLIRDNCQYPKPENGVWHCEEYQ